MPTTPPRGFGRGSAARAQQAEGKVRDAINDRKLRPAQREWAIAFAVADPEGFAAYVEAAPPIFGDEVGSSWEPPVLEFGGLLRVQAIGLSIVLTLDDLRRGLNRPDRAARVSGLGVELHRFRDALAAADDVPDDLRKGVAASSATALRDLQAAGDAAAFEQALESLREALQIALVAAYRGPRGRPKGTRAMPRAEFNRRLRDAYARLRAVGYPRPTQRLVAARLAIDLSTLTRYLRDYGTTWPPPV